MDFFRSTSTCEEQTALPGEIRCITGTRYSSLAGNSTNYTGSPKFDQSQADGMSDFDGILLTYPMSLPSLELVHHMNTDSRYRRKWKKEGITGKENRIGTSLTHVQLCQDFDTLQLFM